MGSKISKYFDYISAGLLTLISFFCLAFPLMKANITGIGASTNGFTYISFIDTSDWLAILTGVISVLQLCVCVFMVIYFVLILCKGANERDKKIFFIFNIIMICFLFAYMILGILWVALNGSINIADLGSVTGYTLAYIPLLLGVFVFIFYFLQKKMNENGTVKTPAKTPSKKTEEQPAEAKPAAKTSK